MEKPQPALALEDISSIAERLAISRSTIYAWVKDGRFPAPAKLGRNSRWITSEVNAWVEERRPASD
ncbi:helix-turn-helix transcriptional regulator [Pseudoxanthomonas mexicana]